MGLSEKIKDERARGLLVSVPAAGLLHGAVSAVAHDFRWVRPLRFSEDQMRALGSCQAWHPGLFRQMARTTAGIRVEFETDAEQVALEVRIDAEPRGTRAALDAVDRGEAGQLPGAMLAKPHDGLSADVDGRHIWCGMPAAGETLVELTLSGNDPEDAMGLQPLPGLARMRRVCIWLPALRGCEVRDVYCDGSVVRPVTKRKNLLVLGDAFAQGFVSEDPAAAWPSLLANRLKLDLVNQGIQGQVFQPGSLFGLADSVDPERIVVAYGASYRHETCMARRVSRDVRAYLAELSRLWPKVPTHVITPLWHEEQTCPSHAMSCHEKVPSLIEACVSAHPQMKLIDGLELLDHDASVYADGCEYPGVQGNRKIAQRINAVMRVPGLRPSSVGKRRARRRKAPKVEPLQNDDNLQLPL